MRLYGDAETTMGPDLVLEVPNDVRSIEDTVEYVMRQCGTCSDREDRLNLNFRVGLTEALANAMLYGNGDDPSKRVRLQVTMMEGRVQAKVKDQGSGFDPTSVPDPTKPENLTKPCGRGLFLMRELLDEVSFNDRGNEVTLVLRLESGGALEGGVQA